MHFHFSLYLIGPMLRRRQCAAHGARAVADRGGQRRRAEGRFADPVLSF
jgi:hypothetical protein